MSTVLEKRLLEAMLARMDDGEIRRRILDMASEAPDLIVSGVIGHRGDAYTCVAARACISDTSKTQGSSPFTAVTEVSSGEPAATTRSATQSSITDKGIEKAEGERVDAKADESWEIETGEGHFAVSRTKLTVSDGSWFECTGSKKVLRGAKAQQLRPKPSGRHTAVPVPRSEQDDTAESQERPTTPRGQASESESASTRSAHSDEKRAVNARLGFVCAFINNYSWDRGSVDFVQDLADASNKKVSLPRTWLQTYADGLPRLVGGSRGTLPPAFRDGRRRLRFPKTTRIVHQGLLPFVQRSCVAGKRGMFRSFIGVLFEVVESISVIDLCCLACRVFVVCIKVIAPVSPVRTCECKMTRLTRSALVVLAAPAEATVCP